MNGEADRLSPNLRSADRSLLTGRAMVHLAVHNRLGKCGNLDRVGNSGSEGCTRNEVPHSSHTRNGLLHRIGANKSMIHIVDSINPICYSDESGAGHFCPSLAVARKFRLCLHPRGMLRVQSLHLPRKGLGSA